LIYGILLLYSELVKGETMQQDVKILIKVQEIDIKKRDIERKRKELPEKILNVKAQLTGRKNSLQELKEKIKKIESERKTVELEVESKQAQALKYKGQLVQIKTNQEYKALQSEITDIKNECIKLEDIILDIMEKNESAMSEAAKEEALLKQEEDAVLIEEQNIKDQLTREERELEGLLKDREELIPKVDTYILETYSYIFEDGDDIAIVPAKNGTCGGCHIKLTSQIVSDLRKSQEVVACENCGRILYYMLEV